MLKLAITRIPSHRIRSLSGVGFRRFSSSSHKPGLSNRTKRDLLILALGTCGAGYYIGTSNEWEAGVRIAIDQLLAISCQKVEYSDSLPTPVQRYLEKVCKRGPTEDQTPSIASIHQHGEFYALRQWYPFQATLWAAVSNRDPGFVWDAETTILKMPNRVLETYISDKGSITTKAWGKYPLIQVEEEEPYILFWLAMSPLFPDVLSQSGKLAWKSANDLHQANATLVNGDDIFDIEFHFDGDLLTRTRVTANCLDRAWQAIYRDYSEHSGDSLVPSTIEIGKCDGNDFQAHLKVTNVTLESY